MDAQHNFPRGGFGRRGGQAIQAPPDAARAGLAQPSAGGADAAARERPSATRSVGYFLLAALGLVTLEAMFSDTSVITPISPVVLTVMWGAGLVLGIPLAVLIIRMRSMGILRKIAVLVFIPIFTSYAAEQTAWRVADWILFSFSSEAFAPASYPITHVHRSRNSRRDSFAIDPFGLGDRTEIAVPEDQFRAAAPYALNYCITVMQRRSASGAIEILNDGVYNLHAPAPAILTACPEARRAQELRRMREEARRALARP